MNDSVLVVSGTVATALPRYPLCKAFYQPHSQGQLSPYSVSFSKTYSIFLELSEPLSDLPL
jgi:hypothetical protein